MRTAYFIISFIFIGSMQANAQSISERLSRINSYTQRSDPYKRFFTYNENTGQLKWVTGAGDITCEAKLSDITVYRENSYVSFKTKDGSKNIYCSYGGNTAMTSITVNSSGDADKILEEIEGIAAGGAGSTGTDVNSIINRVNQICREYDNAARIFTYNPNSLDLTWVTKKGDITCKANLGKVTIKMTPASSYNQVTFTCKDGTKCIECNYTGPVSLSAVSIEREKAPAIEMVEKLNLLLEAKNISNVVRNRTNTNGGRDVPQPQRQY